MNQVAPFANDEPKAPHNLHAEQDLLGAVLLNNGALDAAREIVTTTDFFTEAHRRIWEAVLAIADRGDVADPVTLKEYFERDALLESIGGPAYLARLAAGGTTVVNAPHYARAVRRISLRRQLLDIARRAWVRASDPKVDDDISDLVGSLRTEMDNLDSDHGASALLWHGDLLRSGFEKACQTYKDGRPAGIPTGIRSLDDKVGGLEPGNLILIGARPSMGKTALGLAVAISVARWFTQQHGAGLAQARSVLFISLEMSEEQVGQRGLAEASGVPYSDMRNGRVSQDDINHMMLAAKQNVAVPLAYVVQRGLNLHRIRAEIRRAKRKHNCGLVVIDYLGLIEGEAIVRGGSIAAQVGEISRGLKKFAGQFDLPIIALAQLNRDLEKREDKRPQLADLRNSGDLEQDADDVWFLYRDEYYLERREPPPGTPEWVAWDEQINSARGVGEIIVAKNRHGGVGTVRTRFDVARNQIRGIDDPTDPRQSAMLLPAQSGFDLPPEASNFAPLEDQ